MREQPGDKMPPKLRRFGLVFVYPWNYPSKWRIVPSFTKVNNKRVALSFDRWAIVFDIAWYVSWGDRTRT